MKYRWLKLLASTVIVGFFFWLYSSTTGLFLEGPFANYPDCQTVRAWAAAIPTPSPTPGATITAVSPGCYYMNTGGN